MTNRAVISAHTKTEVSERLEKLATATKRSKSFLAGEAIERYLTEEEDFLASVERGRAQADVGEGIPTDKARQQLTERLEAKFKTARA